jgi:hypothetical protein
MKELTNCPFCHGDFVVKEVECQGCKTEMRGTFKTNRFHLFGAEDLFFIEIFLKNEGNIKLVEKDLGISYPTVKNRLKQIIKTLGYQQENQSSERIKILNELSDGKIDVDTAMKNLRTAK